MGLLQKHMNHKFEKVARMILQGSPLMAASKLKLEKIDDGLIEVSMPYDAEMIGDPDTGVIHGGAMSTLLDSTCGMAVFAHPDCGELTATINLRIDYMRPATPGQRMFARAEVYHTTRHVAFVRGRAWHQDADEPIALAAGTFTFNATKAKS